MTSKQILELRRRAFMAGKIDMDGHIVRELCDMALDQLEIRGGVHPARSRDVILGLIIGFAFSLCVFLPLSSHGYDSSYDTPRSYHSVPGSSPSLFGNEPTQIYQGTMESFPNEVGRKDPC